MTVWEFEHFRHRSRRSSSNTTLPTQQNDGSSNITGSQKEWNVTTVGHSISAPRLGVDGVKLSHLVGNQASEAMQVVPSFLKEA